MRLKINIIIIFSLTIGSFLNVCIHRIPRQESIAFPGSHCTSCDTTLKAIDLIPIVSYVMNKGKCRYCGDSISPQYPIIEGLNALLCLLIFFRIGLNSYSITLMVMVSILIVIAMIDIQNQIIPDSLNASIIIIGIIQIVLGLGVDSISRLIGLFVGGGIFLLIAVITCGNMGGGDIKLMGALGFVFGWKIVLLITLLSFVLGSIISLILIWTKKASRKDPIAFGPFICLATFIAMIYGRQLIDMYINSFT